MRRLINNELKCFRFQSTTTFTAVDRDKPPRFDVELFFLPNLPFMETVLAKRLTFCLIGKIRFLEWDYVAHDVHTYLQLTKADRLLGT